MSDANEKNQDGGCLPGSASGRLFDTDRLFAAAGISRFHSKPGSPQMTADRLMDLAAQLEVSGLDCGGAPREEYRLFLAKIADAALKALEREVARG